jgi:hypothetical protein
MFLQRVLCKLATVLTCAFVVVSHGWGNLVTNGSFEFLLIGPPRAGYLLAPLATANPLVSPELTAILFNPPIIWRPPPCLGTFNCLPHTNLADWTVVADKVVWFSTNNDFGIAPQDGGFFLDLAPYEDGSAFGGVLQPIDTVPTATYELSFYMGSYGAQSGGVPISVVAWAGGVSRVFTIEAPTAEPAWVPFSMTFTAVDPSTTIAIVGAAGYQYIGLDNVNVLQMQNSPVPEPSTLVLAAVALVAIWTANAYSRAT